MTQTLRDLSAKMISILLLLYVSTGITSELKPTDLWFSCHKDSDCIHIDYNCAGAVVNKDFERIANEYYKTENSRLNCERKEPSPAELKVPYKILCLENKCSIQGIKRKRPGFS